MDESNVHPELAKDRERLRSRLVWLNNRLQHFIDHIGHMDAGDIDRLNPVIEAMLKAKIDGEAKVRHELQVIHSDLDQCPPDQETGDRRSGSTQPEEMTQDPRSWAGKIKDDIKDDFTRPPKSQLLRRLGGWE